MKSQIFDYCKRIHEQKIVTKGLGFNVYKSPTIDETDENYLIETNKNQEMYITLEHSSGEYVFSYNKDKTKSSVVGALSLLRKVDDIRPEPEPVKNPEKSYGNLKDVVQDMKKKVDEARRLNDVFDSEKDALKRYFTRELREIIKIHTMEERAGLSRCTVSKFLDNNRSITKPALTAFIPFAEKVGYKSISTETERINW